MYEAGWQLHAVGAEADAADIEPRVFSLRLGQIRALLDVERDIGEIDFGKPRLQRLGAHSARVQPADHRPHARGRNAIDGDAIFLEHAQHAQMRIPARAAAR